MIDTHDSTLTRPSRILLISLFGLVAFGLAIFIAIAITPITWTGVGWVLFAAVAAVLLIPKIGRLNQ